MDVGWTVELFAFVPAGTVGKHQDFFLAVSGTQALQQFIHAFRIAHRGKEAVAFALHRAHGTKSITVFSDDLFLHHSSLSFGYPAAREVVNATKTGFVFK